MAYLNKYSPRPGTVSERKYEDTISWDEKKRREKELNIVLRAGGQKRNDKFIGQTVRVLVDEVKKEKNGIKTNSGKTDLFKNVHFESARDYTGRFVSVEISKAEPFSLFGELV